ncbi:Holliday junction branch migration protein RuvA [Candidatus Wolfebacteria bacterium]|nr:Holliday junction branch migration protein RuvA [Candidatus Wolfebacteria bacterium]
MISHITGTLIESTLETIVLDVGGVGYRIHISSDTREHITTTTSETTSLWTHLAVRENAMDLYGFVEKAELDFFELLINVPGIGPKSGLAILSLASVETLRQSISSGDTTYLTKVSGIGRKTAEKIVLELKDKLGALEGEGRDFKGESDAVEALRSLGYSLKESRDALKQVGPDVVGTEARVRAALKKLGRAA